MNAGLSNLKTLKDHLLAEVLREGTDYDATLLAIGTGVANQFEKFCNRKWVWTEGDLVAFTAARTHFVVPRFPVHEVTKIEIMAAYDMGWNEQTMDLVKNVHAESGIVRFGSTLGDEDEQVRLTYSGGYWWNINEDAIDSMPDGATALPADLLLAWFLQCRKVWEVSDVLGGGIAKGGSNVALVGLSLAGLDIVPQVKEILRGHIRFQMT